MDSTETSVHDSFAITALRGLLATSNPDQDYWPDVPQELARKAFDIAAAMIAERKRRLSAMVELDGS